MFGQIAAEKNIGVSVCFNSGQVLLLQQISILIAMVIIGISPAIQRRETNDVFELSTVCSLKVNINSMLFC